MHGVIDSNSQLIANSKNTRDTKTHTHTRTQYKFVRRVHGNDIHTDSQRNSLLLLLLLRAAADAKESNRKEKKKEEHFCFLQYLHEFDALPEQFPIDYLAVEHLAIQ